jgi:exonuclease-1
LEKIGLVDGIITEDSDLLVFGCRTVLFKLDDVACTITSISRSDFASVATEGGISLLGWSDVQFRAMAILSGCDYLPSISGIGLKTAWSLMRKYKTAENVIKAIRLEGKKTVPRTYWQSFKMADRVFLHQRVYDPVKREIVCLTEVPEGDVLDAETEAYIGR